MKRERRLLAWQELPPGGLILEPGNSSEIETGTWRSERPVLKIEKCTHCLFCWLYCPDQSIVVKDGKMTGFDYYHCKGCGVCSEVCPPKAIEMTFEGELEG